MSTILIDGYNLGLEKGTGVATYGRNLSRQVSQMGHDVSVLYGMRFGDKSDPLLREIMFFDPDQKKPKKHEEALRLVGNGLRSPFTQSPREVALSGSVIQRSFESRMPSCKHVFNGSQLFERGAASFILWERLLPVRMPQTPDIAHWTYPLPVRAKGAPNIYTLHDLVPLRLPYTTLDNKKRYLKLLKEITRTAEHIVTVSECSKRDIVELLGVDEDRVTNTYQSVHLPDSMRGIDEAQVALEVEGVTGAGYKDYLLFWGSIEPKKNIDRMIEAYLSSGVQTPLVIVGAMAWKKEQQLRLLKNESVKRSKRVIQLSYAPLSLLVSLIRGAKAALFPSLYEGFGLPALEAMQLGTPVICSNTGSLPEVAGDAALMVDPYNAQAMGQAIRKIDADADLRAELVTRGKAQSAKFSGEAYRDRLNTLYKRLL